MITIRCTVERITYQNPENGYSVLRVSSPDFREVVTVVGNLAGVAVGSVLLLEGDWKVDSKYGSQFSAERWEETVPATVHGIEKYLGSGLIHGVGPAFAKRIVAEFGLDTISVIENDPDRLEAVEGIGHLRAERIRESWEQQKEIKNVMLFLQGYDVSTAYAVKIYKTYGRESVAKMKENPYRLADDIWGIGFRTADRIAEKLGFEKDDYLRCRSGILYTLSQLADDGHCYAEQEQLIARAIELLESSEAALTAALLKMLDTGDLIREENAIFLPAFLYAEVGASGRLKDLATTPSRQTVYPRVSFEKLTKATEIEYDEIQRRAIQLSVDAKIMILTGGPGTGKTTTTRGILRVLSALGLKILLAAPTGRAAKRLSEATGMEAKTVHRLLECKPPEGYQRNENNPLSGDVLIVDESSMLDLILFYALLRALPDSMKLILVGDIDQLPSVGPGNVLRDLIDSGCFPVVRLERIFRQAQQSRIIQNAHRINAGQFPDLTNRPDSDFFYLEQEDPS